MATLFVGQLPFSHFFDLNLWEMFGSFGNVVNARLNIQRGESFVTLERTEEADMAIAMLHGRYVMAGRRHPLQVMYAHHSHLWSWYGIRHTVTLLHDRVQVRLPPFMTRLPPLSQSEWMAAAPPGATPTFLRLPAGTTRLPTTALEQSNPDLYGVPLSADATEANAATRSASSSGSGTQSGTATTTTTTTTLSSTPLSDESPCARVSGAIVHEGDSGDDVDEDGGGGGGGGGGRGTVGEEQRQRRRRHAHRCLRCCKYARREHARHSHGHCDCCARALSSSLSSHAKGKGLAVTAATAATTATTSRGSTGRCSCERHRRYAEKRRRQHAKRMRVEDEENIEIETHSREQSAGVLGACAAPTMPPAPTATVTAMATHELGAHAPLRVSGVHSEYAPVLSLQHTPQQPSALQHEPAHAPYALPPPSSQQQEQQQAHVPPPPPPPPPQQAQAQASQQQPSRQGMPMVTYLVRPSTSSASAPSMPPHHMHLPLETRMAGRTIVSIPIRTVAPPDVPAPSVTSDTAAASAAAAAAPAAAPYARADDGAVARPSTSLGTAAATTLPCTRHAYMTRVLYGTSHTTTMPIVEAPSGVPVATQTANPEPVLSEFSYIVAANTTTTRGDAAATSMVPATAVLSVPMQPTPHDPSAPTAVLPHPTPTTGETTAQAAAPASSTASDATEPVLADMPETRSSSASTDTLPIFASLASRSRYKGQRFERRRRRR